jgi:hypothetical protein
MKPKELSISEIAYLCEVQEKHPQFIGELLGVNSPKTHSLSGEYLSNFKKLWNAVKRESVAINTWNIATDFSLPRATEANGISTGEFIFLVDCLLADSFKLNQVKPEDLLSIISQLVRIIKLEDQELLELKQSSPNLLSRERFTKVKRINTKELEISKLLGRIEILKYAYEQSKFIHSSIRAFRTFFRKSNDTDNLQQSYISSKEVSLKPKDGIHPAVIISLATLVIGVMNLNGISTPEQLADRVKPAEEKPKTEYTQIEGGVSTKELLITIGEKGKKYLGISETIIDTRSDKNNKNNEIVTTEPVQKNNAFKN